MNQAMFLSMMTADEQPFLLSPSCAEAVVTVIFYGREQGWFKLLAFSVLPDEVQLVVVPQSQEPENILRNVQFETTPLLSALVRPKGRLWDTRVRMKALRSQEAVRAQIENVHRTPVILGRSKRPSDYPFCSANPRFHNNLDS